MAVVSKKDKLIEEAQKCAARGQFDKAAKAYEQILALEPAVINHRQKLAELLLKCNRNEDARKELETVGKHFGKNGFYLKAIAVYKQVQKLFPTDISVSLTLAELNEKHGLTVNALAEYKSVYEFYEKSGKSVEALGILDRMQNADPQNVPIKIKLGEAYFQAGKQDDSFRVFSKLIVVLLEKGDSATLGKIVGRIRQLFPARPDFLLDILAEQVSQGNAAIAIEAIQGQLRSNPVNKRAWELVVEAYRQLQQPQRVKLAFQHFLKFFPEEPVAQLGVIAATAEEKNLAGALELLDQYEEKLLTAAFAGQLEQIYHVLDKIDPINVRVLEGLIRVATVTGNSAEVTSLTSKLASLRSLAGKGVPSAPAEEIDVKQPPDLFAAPSYSFAEEPGSAVSGTVGNESPFAAPPDELPAAFPPPVDDEAELDIEIEIDLDSPFELAEAESGPGTTVASAANDWLDSVGELFDTISTSPRGVKFGDGVESSDAQSHFDLGQAFKEMGLYDEAINEFRQAAHDPPRRVECMIMQCVCLRERGEVDKATTMLQALLKPGLTDEESCAVKYELATAYEMTGRKDDATALLNEINAVDPSFRDIGSRLNAANLSESLDFSDDDLDGFGFD